MSLLNDYRKSRTNSPASAAHPPTIQQSLEEAVQNTLAKESKLEVTSQAIMLDDLDELAVRDRDTPERYMRERVFKDDPKQVHEDMKRTDEDMVGRIIVCDDLTIESPKKSGLGPAVKAAIAISAIAAGGIPATVAVWNLTRPKAEAPVKPVDPKTQNFELGLLPPDK